MKNVLIVLNYKDADTTTSFIKMALKCEAIEKIVVVDNCSKDGSFEQLSDAVYNQPRVEVIETVYNGGYAYGNNFGCNYAIEKYSPEFLFISNPDVSFSNQTIVEMLGALSEFEDMGIIAPIVNNGYNVWNLPDFSGLLESILLISHNLHKRNIKKRLLLSKRSLEKVGVVEGSFFALKSKCFLEANGFDERTFLYYEENIMAKRLKTKTYNEYVLTQCRYDHYHSLSIKKRYGGKVRAFKNFHKSMLLYLNEYLGSTPIKRALFEIIFGIGYAERFAYDIITYLRYLLKHQ